MVNPSRIKGTQAESAVVAFLRANGFHGAERRALAGAFDLGDVVGLGPIVVECKAGAAAAKASDGQVLAWLRETEAERQHADADYGLLVLKRAGIGPARAGDWWCVIPLWTLLHLRGQYDTATALADIGEAPIRLLLRDAVRLLRLAGYGDSIDTAKEVA